MKQVFATMYTFITSILTIKRVDVIPVVSNTSLKANSTDDECCGCGHCR